jgi:hypothetical protein
MCLTAKKRRLWLGKREEEKQQQTNGRDETKKEGRNESLRQEQNHTQVKHIISSGLPRSGDAILKTLPA